MQPDNLSPLNTAGKLPDSSELYRQLVQNLPGLAVIVFDTALRLMAAEGSLLRAMGFSPEHMVGKTMWEILSPESCEVLVPPCREALAGTKVGLDRQIGDHIYHADILPVRNDQGEICAGMFVAQDITEQRHTEAALRESEDRYHSLFNNSLDGILLTDPDGPIFMANPAACQMLDRTEEEIKQIGRSGIVDLTDPRVAVALEKRQRTGQVRAELHFLRHDGTPFPVEATSRVYQGQDGRLKTSMIFRDISERKRAEETLRESEERFRQLAENAHQIFWLVALDEDRTIYISPSYETIYERSLQSFYDNPQSFIDALHPDDQERIRKLRREKLREGYSTEYRMVRADGSIRWLISRVFPVKNAEGKVYRAAGITEDVTERKRAEESLHENQRFLEQIASAMPDLLYVNDLIEQCNVYANREVMNVLGYTPEEILAMGSQLFVNLLHPDDLALLGERFKRFDSAQDNEVIETVYRMRRTDGTWCWFHSREVIFKRLANGSPWQVLGVGSDITLNKQLEAQAIELGIERERIRVLTDFVRDASHDFRTPLSVINSSAYLMYKVPDPQKRAEYQQKIGEQVSRLERTLESMLTMSRLDSTDSFVYAPISINRLLRDILAGIAHQIEQAQIRVNYQLDETLPPIQANASELGLALLNIIKNAMQFTPAGGLITVRPYRKDSFMVVEIQDTGPGISATDLCHIFERFYRADRARSSDKGGSGLGLPIAKRIVEIHQGRIEVESTEGQGSIFRVLLPISNTVPPPPQW